MAKRSLQASSEGIRKAKQAFKRKGWTQEYLASAVGLETRQPIWKFFTGKPIDRQAFNEICFILELDPSEISQKPAINESISTEPTENPTHQLFDIDAVVQKLRAAHYDKIQSQCGSLHLLDIAQPIELNDLYIDVNILEEMTSKRWVENTNRLNYDASESDRFGLGKIRQKRVWGIEAFVQYSKLMLLGKPGAGKTTFLQSIAISCNQGFFQPDCLPIFITLKNFTDDTKGRSQINLFSYIYESFANFGITEQELITVLSHGKALILLDGLDEVAGEDCDEVIKSIRYFLDNFYRTRVVITCRIAAQSYKFYGFTEVEIADFTKTQIAAFAQKWFLTVAKNSHTEARALAQKFMQKLDLAENRQFLELATTPILLNLTCLLFQFIEDFPVARSELYRKGLELLLVRWDEARGIKRDQAYRDLSLLQKIKLLSRIAAITFAQGDYLLPEAKMRQLITDYLRHLPNATTDADALDLESVSILKAIEAQHGLLIERARGIYSFSHLTFQEYFTAREIVAHASTETLSELVNHLNEKRWREVFLLSVEILHPADELLKLMKQKINAAVNNDAKLKNFLHWISRKTSAVNAPHHPASVRAFYFTLALPPEHPLACNQSLAISLDHQIASNLAVDLALDLALTHALSVSLAITADIFFQRFIALNLALDLEHLLKEQPSLQTALQDIKNLLPSANQGREALKIWWLTNGEIWIEKLRNLLINDRQIGQVWLFTPEEWPRLQQYWDDNQLLMNCLKGASNVTPDVQKSIENSLFAIEQL
ncbi:NACHT domain-containing protein [Fortiea contorta]|uniref:NACHT domain-containing protein n=1 Tax=Fortiea contorta TaxID=1892405 RepID=UPI00037A22FF|nr:NACHT domain-containing NTPase [Fortiea contorta]